MNCECCNYKTDNKTSFRNHLKTNKHLKNMEREAKKEVDSDEELDLDLMTDEEYKEMQESLNKPIPEYNKNDILDDITKHGGKLLYHKLNKYEYGYKDEKAFNRLVKFYYDRKYENTTYENKDKNNLFMLSRMLVFVYHGYLGLVQHHNEHKRIGREFIEDYRGIELENKLLKERLGYALEEIAQLKASRNQTG